MKSLRPLLLGIALLGVPGMVAADDVNSRLGVLGGLNIATLDIEATAGRESRLGVLIGGVYERDLNDRWGLRVEPSFVNKGAKVTQRDAYLGSVDKLEIKLAYIEVPVLLRLNLSDDEAARGYLLVGGAIAFRTSAEAELDLSGVSQTADFDDIVRDLDAGLQFGLGADFAAGPTTRIFADGRFSLGLVNVSKGGSVDAGGSQIVVDPRPVKTRDFRVLLGVTFPWPGS